MGFMAVRPCTDADRARERLLRALREGQALPDGIAEEMLKQYEEAAELALADLQVQGWLQPGDVRRLLWQREDLENQIMALRQNVKALHQEMTRRELALPKAS